MFSYLYSNNTGLFSSTLSLTQPLPRGTSRLENPPRRAGAAASRGSGNLHLDLSHCRRSRSIDYTPGTFVGVLRYVIFGSSAQSTYLVMGSPNFEAPKLAGADRLDAGASPAKLQRLEIGGTPPSGGRFAAKRPGNSGRERATTRTIAQSQIMHLRPPGARETRPAHPSGCVRPADHASQAGGGVESWLCASRGLSGRAG